MKLNWDKKYLRWGITAFLVIVASMIVLMVLNASESINSFFSLIISAISPVLLGIAFAYILNPLLNLIEVPAFRKWGEKLFAKSEYKDRKAKSFSRAIALLITVILVLIFLALLLWLIIPKLIDSVSTMIANIPTYSDNIRNFFANLFAGNESLRLSVLDGFDSVADAFQDFLKNDLLSSLTNYADTIFSGIVGFVTGFFNLIVGLIIAIYMLAGKEKFSAQCKKLIYSIFNTDRATKIIVNTKKVDKIFTGFISGKVIDSFIIGILCYIVLAIFNIPYKELVAVFVGVTNVIPFFGPFIGAIPSAFLILTVSPLDCIIFIVIIVVLQQVDGNVIGPKILGESTGLSGFWVLCSLLVFGSLFGFIGMLIGVPTFAAIYAFIKSTVADKLEAKKISNDTDAFREIDYIDPETGNPVMKPTKEELEAIRLKEKEEKKKAKEDKIKARLDKSKK